MTKPATAIRAPAPPSMPAPPRDPSLEGFLFAEPFAFDFFQAVRVLEKVYPDRKPLGHSGPAAAEIVRFRAYISLNFPPSSIYDLARPAVNVPVPIPFMIVTFMGLTGPSGMLPRHYTELLMRQERDAKGPEKHALRDWFDIFNHRMISLFYRSWEKYRFYIPYERGTYRLPEPDPFTLALYCLVGLGMQPKRNRLIVTTWEEVDEQPRKKTLAKIDDLALLFYGGFLSHRPRNAVSLETLLGDYFQMPVRIQQFRGQWLMLDPENQSRMATLDGNNQLGVNVVAGERVWDVQSKFRVRLGPLRLSRFNEFLPDRSASAERKAFFLLCHLARFYAGPELDFEVQLVLSAEDVPECQLTEGVGLGPRLGWNTWVCSQPLSSDAEEAVFEGEDIVSISLAS